MNTDVEELLREGMERFTAGVRAPAGLAHTASGLRRRRMAVRAAVACGAAAVTATVAVVVAVGAGGTPGRTNPGMANTRTTAYVISRVDKALARQHLVLRGRTTTTAGPSVSWAYGPRHRFEEFTGTGKPFLVQGTALIDGKLTGVYVTYYNHEWSLLPQGPAPASACSRGAAIEMAGPPIPASNWPAFIRATLACGAATMTGHAWIGGVRTLKITGSPVTERLSPGEARAIHEKWLRAQWTLYVNPKTYLPARLSSAAHTYGGPAPSALFTTVTDLHWLRPTTANIAKALVTIPPGFRQVSSPANQ
jgi:hypothetical protein